MADIDIWRSAAQLVTLHGDAAAMEAAHQADRLLGRQDVEGYYIWKRIISAIQELESETSKSGRLN